MHPWLLRRCSIPPGILHSAVFHNSINSTSFLRFVAFSECSIPRGILQSAKASKLRWVRAHPTKSNGVHVNSPCQRAFGFTGARSGGPAWCQSFSTARRPPWCVGNRVIFESSFGRPPPGLTQPVGQKRARAIARAGLGGTRGAGGCGFCP